MLGLEHGMECENESGNLKLGDLINFRFKLDISSELYLGLLTHNKID